MSARALLYEKVETIRTLFPGMPNWKNLRNERRGQFTSLNEYRPLDKHSLDALCLQEFQVLLRVILENEGPAQRLVSLLCVSLRRNSQNALQSQLLQKFEVLPLGETAPINKARDHGKVLWWKKILFGRDLGRRGVDVF